MKAGSIAGERLNYWWGSSQKVLLTLILWDVYG